MKVRWCEVRKIRRIRKGVVATGQCFHLGKGRIVNRGVFLYEGDGFV